MGARRSKQCARAATLPRWSPGKPSQFNAHYKSCLARYPWAYLKHPPYVRRFHEISVIVERERTTKVAVYPSVLCQRLYPFLFLFVFSFAVPVGRSGATPWNLRSDRNEIPYSSDIASIINSKNKLQHISLPISDTVRRDIIRFLRCPPFKVPPRVQKHLASQRPRHL